MVFADKSTKLEKTENVIGESNTAEIIMKAFKSCYSGDFVKAEVPGGQRDYKYSPWTTMNTIKRIKITYLLMVKLFMSVIH